MGRSQRHMILEQGAPANGEPIAQGEAAPTYVSQYLTGDTPPEQRQVPDFSEVADSLVVPIGPAGGPLQGSTMAGAIPDPDGGIPPEPEPGDEFLILALNPNEAPAESPDFSVTVHGRGFEDGAVIVFGGADQATTFVDETQAWFLSPNSTQVPGPVQVLVRNPGGEMTNELTMTFLPPGRGAERGTPLGPLTILRIEDHEDGIQVELSDASSLKVDGMVLIEATGNTNINGRYEVWSIDGNTVIVNNDYTLDAPIEGKGRLTVTDAN